MGGWVVVGGKWVVEMSRVRREDGCGWMFGYVVEGVWMMDGGGVGNGRREEFDGGVTATCES